VSDSIYDKAADYLRQYGWTQGSYFAFVPRHPGGFGSTVTRAKAERPAACVSGAIMAVTEDASTWNRAIPPLDDLLAVDLLHWNDAPERTLEDVLLLLKQADCQLDAEGRA